MKNRVGSFFVDVPLGVPPAAVDVPLGVPLASKNSANLYDK